MKILRNAHITLVSVLLATAAIGQGASKVWIVDAAGGGDFATIQEAVDAAIQGNSILVRPGTYAQGVLIRNKSLRLVADPLGAAEITGLDLVGHGLDRDVYISGFRFNNVRVGQPNTPLSAVHSELFFENCVAYGATGIVATVRVEPAETLGATFVSCDLTGSWGCLESSSLCNAEHRGGTALWARGDHTLAYYCQLEGGKGGASYAPFCFGGLEEVGGPALHIGTPFFFNSRNTISGGWGGMGPQDPMICECTTQNCVPNFEAPAIEGGQVTNDATPMTRLRIPDLLREGQPYEIRVTGQPGKQVTLLAARRPDVRPFGTQVGVLHLRQPFSSVTNLGTINAAGDLVIPAVAPTLPAGEESEITFYQLLVHDSGTRYLSNPTGSLVVGAGF